MRFERLRTEPGARLLDCDIDGHGRIAMLQEIDQLRYATIDGRRLHALPGVGASRARHVRWLTRDGLLVMHVAEANVEPSEVCGLVTGSGAEFVPFGVPDDLFTSPEAVFATYRVQSLGWVREPSFEDDIVTVFDPVSKQRRFGLIDILGRMREDPFCDEVTSGCATGDGEFVFIGWDTPRLWSLSAAGRSYTAVLPEESIGVVDLVQALAVRKDDAIVMWAEAAGLVLRWIDRRTGATRRCERLSGAAIAGVLGAYADPDPLGRYSLHADLRGLDGGRFLFTTAAGAYVLTP